MSINELGIRETVCADTRWMELAQDCAQWVAMVLLLAAFRFRILPQYVCACTYLLF